MKNVVCVKCKLEDNITNMNKYQSKGIIYYECLDNDSCQSRIYMTKNHNTYGDLKKFNVDFKDLELLHSNSRCFSTTYRHNITGKFYKYKKSNTTDFTTWEEVTQPDHSDHAQMQNIPDIHNMRCLPVFSTFLQRLWQMFF